jgi:hypothetical protein
MRGISESKKQVVGEKRGQTTKTTFSPMKFVVHGRLTVVLGKDKTNKQAPPYLMISSIPIPIYTPQLHARFYHVQEEREHFGSVL